MRRIVLAQPDELRLGLRHDDTLVSVPAGGPPRVGGEVAISLWARGDVGLGLLELRSIPDGEERIDRMRVVEQRGGLLRWEARVEVPVPRFRYRFRVHGPGGLRHLAMRGLSSHDPVDAFDFTLLAAAPGAPAATVDWPLDAVLYQIFPDRFAASGAGHAVRDGEWSLDGVPTRALPFGSAPLPWGEGRNLDFQGGDLPGIEQRLGHLTHLGVTALFLNPIGPARTNHRYDVTDHAAVDEHLGGDAALASLTAALRARAMRLILDVVLNHTGRHHPWFEAAKADRGAPSAGYYHFEDWPARYRSWNGHALLPSLDLSAPGLRERLFGGPDSALGRLLRPPLSVDGFRFDVANQMGRDGLAQGHRALWAEVRAALRAERSDAWLVGEHFYDPDKLLKGDGLDGVMAYHAFTLPLRAFLTGRDRDGVASALDGAGFARGLRESFARVGWSAWRRSTTHVNTHDLPRLQTFGHAVGGLDRAAAWGALDVATALQLALPGVPCLYYGDEVGLEGGDDPDNRRAMEWDERRQDRGRLERTRALVHLRRASPALRRGGLYDLGSAGDVLAFARVLGGADSDEVRVIVASRAPEPLAVTVDLTGLGRGPLTVDLPPMSAVIV